MAYLLRRGVLSGYLPGATYPTRRSDLYPGSSPHYGVIDPPLADPGKHLALLLSYQEQNIWNLTGIDAIKQDVMSDDFH